MDVKLPYGSGVQNGYTQPLNDAYLPILNAFYIICYVYTTDGGISTTELSRKFKLN